MVNGEVHQKSFLHNNFVVILIVAFLVLISALLFGMSRLIAQQSTTLQSQASESGNSEVQAIFPVKPLTCQNYKEEIYFARQSIEKLRVKFDCIIPTPTGVGSLNPPTAAQRRPNPTSTPGVMGESVQGLQPGTCSEIFLIEQTLNQLETLLNQTCAQCQTGGSKLPVEPTPSEVPGGILY